LTLTTCGRNGSVTGLLPFEPVITFSGIFEPLGGGGGEEVELNGNFSFRNSCRLVGDTVRMYLYSNNFSENAGVRSGYLLWIDIYPLVRDSLDTLRDDQNILSVRDVLVRLSEYADPQFTYRVSRPDSAQKNLSASMQIESLERRRGGAIVLHEVSAILHREGNTTPAFAIREGEIRGQVETLY
jgi:hypothetical protein